MTLLDFADAAERDFLMEAEGLDCAGGEIFSNVKAGIVHPLGFEVERSR